MSSNIGNPASTAPQTERRRRPRGNFELTLASARSTVSFRETLRLAYDSFSASKTRFLLTMLGMIIGSASIVLVVTVGLTGKQYALDTLSGLGPNKIEMQYTGGVVMGPGNVSAPDYMTIEDMHEVDQEVPGIVASSPMLEYHDSVSIGNGQQKDVMLLGVSPQYKQVRNLQLKAGRFFDDQDAVTRSHVTDVVGKMAIELYGSYAAAVGQTLSIKGIPFTIIGVFTENIDTQGMSEISSHTILVPYEVARYFTGSDTLKEIFFSMTSSNEVGPGAQQITEIIQSRHRTGSVYHAETLVDILKDAAQIANMLTIVLILASAITLIVAGVGIMNSMLANVQSRLKEIGIRKALGATSREIRLQFLTESVLLSMTGGIIGTVVGLGLPFSVRFFTDFKIPMGLPWSALIALGTSMGVGIVFGTLPANRAAKLDPVSTLKYE
jgi:putative ABC transport system permease protein